MSSPVLLFKGSDPSLVGDAVADAVRGLVGDEDRSLMVDEFDADRYEHDGVSDVGGLVDAAQTPPFLTPGRVVVGRQLAMFKIADLDALLGYLATPMPSTTLVLVWERGPRSGDTLPAVPKRLADAVAACGGEVIDTNAGRGKQRSAWIEEQLAAADLRLDAAGRNRLADHLGEDPGRLPGVIATLVGVFGAGAKLGADDLEPYLIGDGDVAPWDLTDAIDRGDTAGALGVLARMLDAGRHPLQIMATLHNHIGRMVALDGAGAHDERAAAEILGIKGSTFPAKKALQQGRKLGSARLAAFVELLAEADLDLRGAKHLPDEAVIEVVVARLASRSRR